MMTEEEIIRLISRGGEEAQVGFKAFYDDLAQYIISYFIYRGRISREEASDVLQITALKIFMGARNYSDQGKAKAWIWRIARNCLKDHFRKYPRYKDALDEDIELKKFFSDYQSEDEHGGLKSDAETPAPDDAENNENDWSQEPMSIWNLDDKKKDMFIESNYFESVDKCFRAKLEKYSKKYPLGAYALKLKMDGESDEEISIQIGLSVGGTRTYLWQCRKQIKPYLEDCKELLESTSVRKKRAHESETLDDAAAP